MEPPQHMPQSCIIAVKYHWFWEKLGKEMVYIEKIDRKLQWVNILTEALPRVKFEAERKMLCGW